MMYRVFPVLAILLAIALFVWYINPTYTGEIVKSQQQIASYNSALVAAQTFTDKEKELIAQRNAIPAGDIARLESFLPDGVDNVQLILDLNSLAARSGVTLSNFSVQENQTDSSRAVPIAGADTSNNGDLQSSSLTNSLNVSVSATGTYSAFRTFLAAAEQSLRPLDVTNFSLHDSASGVYTYDITFRIYWLH